MKIFRNYEHRHYYSFFERNKIWDFDYVADLRTSLYTYRVVFVYKDISTFRSNNWEWGKMI